MAVTQEDVISALKECYDPEIPVNIVDLGLIYEVKFEPAPGGEAGCDGRHDFDRARLPGARGDQRSGKVATGVTARGAERECEHRVDAGVDTGASEHGCTKTVGH